MNDQHLNCITSPEPAVTMTATDPSAGAALLRAAMAALQGVSLAAYSEALSQDNRIHRNLRSMPNPAYWTACENPDQEGKVAS